jgi:hypothetical protein
LCGTPEKGGIDGKENSKKPRRSIPLLLLHVLQRKHPAPPCSHLLVLARPDEVVDVHKRTRLVLFPDLFQEDGGLLDELL